MSFRDRVFHKTLRILDFRYCKWKTSFLFLGKFNSLIFTVAIIYSITGIRVLISLPSAIVIKFHNESNVKPRV